MYISGNIGLVYHDALHPPEDDDRLRGTSDAFVRSKICMSATENEVLTW